MVVSLRFCQDLSTSMIYHTENLPLVTEVSMHVGGFGSLRHRIIHIRVMELRMVQPIPHTPTSHKLDRSLAANWFVFIQILVFAVCCSVMWLPCCFEMSFFSQRLA